MTFRIPCLALAIILAGCGQPGNDPVIDAGGRMLRLGLADLAQVEVLQFEVRGAPGTQLSLHFSDVYSLNEDLPYCNVVGFTGQQLASLGAGQPFQVASNAAPLPSVSSVIDRGQFNATAEGIFEIPPSGSSVLTFGYDSAKEWLASGAQVELLVQASQDVHWKRLASGDMGCLNDYDDYSGGQYAISPAGSYAVDLNHEFTLEHAGQVWIAPQADLGYALRFFRGAQLIYADSKEANQPPESLNLELEPGSYRLTIDSIAGTTDTYIGLLYFDTA